MDQTCTQHNQRKMTNKGKLTRCAGIEHQSGKLHENCIFRLPERFSVRTHRDILTPTVLPAARTTLLFWLTFWVFLIAYLGFAFVCTLINFVTQYYRNLGIHCVLNLEFEFGHALLKHSSHYLSESVQGEIASEVRRK